MSFKRLRACIFIESGKAVKWFDDHTVISDDVVALAKYYNGHGADELLVFDLSTTDDEHDEAIGLLKRITRVVRTPIIAGGNIKRQEDVKKILYAGARRAMLNFSKEDAPKMIEDVANRFGKEKIAVSLNDFDALFKNQRLINEFSSEIVFMHRLDLDSVVSSTDVPCTVLTDTMEENELFTILKCSGVKALAGKYVSQIEFDLKGFKEKCEKEGIVLTTFESRIRFEEFHTNEKGQIPVIIQHYRTQEVLMHMYMNEEAFSQTVKTGKLNYYDENSSEIRIMGENSGNIQYVKSLTADLGKETLLAKVDSAGPACPTGHVSCYMEPVIGKDYDEINPLQVFEEVYRRIIDRRDHPKEGSYTNYLFDKGIDKILKKVGEEATELIIAGKNTNPEEIKYEMADLLYHAMVLMVERGVTWEDIVRELADR